MKKPKGKFWKGAKVIHLWLKDEIPKLGSGHRWSYCKLGRKWAYICDPVLFKRIKVRLKTIETRKVI